uniref:Uncharacterized protein n=1 Tax=Oryza meridionalis TaxID=40149 RepID=A0A0E0D472_9ORYZ
MAGGGGRARASGRSTSADVAGPDADADADAEESSPEAAGELRFPSRSPNRRGFWGGWNLGEKSASGVELESVAVYRRLWRDNA